MKLYTRTPKIDAPALRSLYLDQKLSMTQIASQLNISRVAVWRYIKRFSIPLRPLHVSLSCALCGKPFTVHSKRSNKAFYCSSKCYHDHRRSISHYAGECREGQRKARLVTQAKKGQVVHHIDGNPTNNAPENLLVFNSQAEHIKHHHSLRKQI